jgi:hypothetical protein
LIHSSDSGSYGDEQGTRRRRSMSKMRFPSSAPLKKAVANDECNVANDESDSSSSSHEPLQVGTRKPKLTLMRAPSSAPKTNKSEPGDGRSLNAPSSSKGN